jgi:hypothetical protein
MSTVIIDARLSIPRLQKADQVATYLGWFFTSGRSQAGRTVSITRGLWPLLQWCWSLPPSRRDASALCGYLLHEPGYGWREESDVLEAMSRDAAAGNPSRLALQDVAGFVEALLVEGERGRGKAQCLHVELEFLLPRLAEHPIFPADRLESALREHGMPENRIRYHREVVHPELQSYLGTWEISLGDRSGLDPVGAPDAPLSIPISAPACGMRSLVALSLRHQDELAPYFLLSLGGGEFPA